MHSVMWHGHYIGAISVLFTPWADCVYADIWIFWGRTAVFCSYCCWVSCWQRQPITSSMFVQGPSNAIAAPIAGWLFDVTCSYTSAFYLGGSCFLASFFLICFIPCVKKRSSQLPGSNQQMDLDMKKYTSPAKLQWTESSV
eukprot:m.164405 g.164405  ORF g.164405 m.164405 type:complete len:141 (+) comp38875_c0_seq5:304-726(+)